MAQSTEIIGLKELKRNLSSLPRAMHDTVLLAGTRKAAMKMKRIARSKCPVGRGTAMAIKSGKKKGMLKKVHLRDTIAIKKIRDPWKKTVKYVVHAGKGLRYAHLVEFGSSPHVIKAHSYGFKVKGGAVLRLPNRTFVPRVLHPGAKARPFMRPAFDEGASIALSEAIAEINKQITALGGKWNTR